jgi:predicted secreted protein
MRFITIIFITVISLSYNSFAKSENKLTNTYLNTSVTDYQEVTEDILSANLRFDFEGNDPQKVQNHINEKMSQILKMAKKIPELEVSTDQYYVYKNYSNDQDKKKKESWTGSQSIIITSKFNESVLKFAHELQNTGLLMNSLNYSISSELEQKTRDSLTENLINKLMTKAEKFAKFTGKSQAQIIELNVDNNNIYDNNMKTYNVSSLKATKSDLGEAALPVSSPKQQKITATISAKFLLK